MMRNKNSKLISKGTAVLLCFFAAICYGQSDNSSLIQSRFSAYQQSHVQEKLFVHTDKSFYLAGELLWFKIYEVDGSFHKPIHLSKVAYVEVLDGQNKPVMQAKVSLQEGDGSGSFYLPVSLNSGNYTFRAYTAWMKNFSADYYFQKPITIVNSLKTANLPAHNDSVRYAVQFFPEGGNLVTNLTSALAFEATDSYGKGVDFTGMVVNERGDTIATFRPLKFGMGHFSFKPEGDHSYTAWLKMENGKTIKQSLPAALPNGYVMSLSEGGINQIKITVSTNVVSNSNAVMYLLVHTRGVIKATQEKPLANGKAEFLVDKASLGEGISSLTIFNEGRQPVCERLYFKMPTQKLNIEAKSDLPQYSARQKVTVAVTANDEENSVVPSDLSAAVYKWDSLSTPEAGIYNYLWLSSDLKGHIESPEYYFSNSGTETQQALDNLMLTHGWRRFAWEEALKNDPAVPEFLPEYNGHLVIGKITDARTGAAAAGVETYLSAPGTQLQFYGAVSNEKGMVLFNTKELYGPNEVVVQTDPKRDNTYRIEISNPFSNQYASDSLLTYNLEKEKEQALLNHSIETQVQNAYLANKLSQFGLPAIDSLPFYGHHAKRYLLDDYTRFTTMEEVLREYVMEVGVRKRGNHFHLPVSKELERGLFENDPLILLDGVPVFDADKIISYDPLKVRKLDVVTSRYYYGPFTFYGIINFTTYNGSMEGLPLDPHAIVLDYDGLQLKREFYAPVYETPQQAGSRMPDFRNLLYWSPAIKTKADGKTTFSFYTSDVPGKYTVVLQGLNREGKAGSQSFMFEVK